MCQNDDILRRFHLFMGMVCQLICSESMLRPGSHVYFGEDWCQKSMPTRVKKSTEVAPLEEE